MIWLGWQSWALACGAACWASFWVSATCWAFREARACIAEGRREAATESHHGEGRDAGDRSEPADRDRGRIDLVYGSRGLHRDGGASRRPRLSEGGYDC